MCVSRNRHLHRWRFRIGFEFRVPDCRKEALWSGCPPGASCWREVSACYLTFRLLFRRVGWVLFGGFFCLWGVRGRLGRLSAQPRDGSLSGRCGDSLPGLVWASTMRELSVVATAASGAFDELMDQSERGQTEPSGKHGLIQ